MPAYSPSASLMMQLFGRRRRLRVLAAYLLLAWLFALTSSVTHACAAAAHAHAHAPGAASPDREPPQHRHETPCDKFCDDESLSPPTSFKQPFDPLHLDGLPPVPAACCAALAQSESAAVRRAGGEPLPAHVPISIAFLRLRL